MAHGAPLLVQRFLVSDPTSGPRRQIPAGDQALLLASARHPPEDGADDGAPWLPVGLVPHRATTRSCVSAHCPDDPATQKQTQRSVLGCTDSLPRVEERIHSICAYRPSDARDEEAGGVASGRCGRARPLRC